MNCGIHPERAIRCINACTIEELVYINRITLIRLHSAITAPYGLLASSEDHTQVNWSIRPTVNNCTLFQENWKINRGLENNLTKPQFYFMTQIQIQTEVLNKKKLDANYIYRTALSYSSM